MQLPEVGYHARFGASRRSGHLLIAGAFAATALLGPLGSGAAEAATAELGPSILGGAGETFCVAAGDRCTFMNYFAGSDKAQLVVPYDGVITGWRVKGAQTGGGSLQLRVMHPDSGLEFTPGALSAAAANVAGTLNSTSLPVQAGDQLAVEDQCQTSAGECKERLGIETVSGAQLAFYEGAVTEGTPEQLMNLSGEDPNTEAAYNAVEQIAPPQVTGITPPSGGLEGGATLVISGEHMLGVTEVAFGDTPAVVTSALATQVTARIPARAQAGTVDVRVTGPGGISATTTSDQYTYLAPGGGSGPGGGSSGSTDGSGTSGAAAGNGASPPPSAAPSLTQLLISPPAFVAANSGPSVARAVGGQVVFRLSVPASVTFTVQQKVRGSRAGRSCKALSTHGRSKKPCTLLRSKGSFHFVGSAGLNSLHFMGRVNGRALSPGSYQLQAVATDATGVSKPATVGFRIVR